jgi:hypothetical protein
MLHSAGGYFAAPGLGRLIGTRQQLPTPRQLQARGPDRGPRACLLRGRHLMDAGSRCADRLLLRARPASAAS